MFRRPTVSAWTLWLLVAGWVCASTPPATRVAVVNWFAEARAFAHQGRLTLEVACLLTGQCDSPALDTASGPVEPPPRPFTPVEFLGKKIDLACDDAVEAATVACAASRHPVRSVNLPESPLMVPPREPPRARGGQV